MSQRSIEVVVSPIGEVIISAVGFKGAACEQATRALEEALGAVTERTKKPEYHATTTTRAKQKLGA